MPFRELKGLPRFPIGSIAGAMMEVFLGSTLAYNLSRSGDVPLESGSGGSVGISITIQAGGVWAYDSMPLTKNNDGGGPNNTRPRFHDSPQGLTLAWDNS
jgi:hypothetical protein